MPRMQPSMVSAEALDQQVAKPDHIDAFWPTMFSWSRTVRDATGLPLVTLAKRLGISKQAVSKLEANEAAGTISLAKLEELARALDCNLVYGFVPTKSFSVEAQRVQHMQDKARRAKRRMPTPD